MKAKYMLGMFIVFGIIFQISYLSALYIGLADGYVRDTNGNPMLGAIVTTTVDDCSGDGCSGSTTSEADGYYIIANLNIPKNGGLSVTATSGSGYGSASGLADEFHIAHIDVIICFAPSLPVLESIPFSHDTAIVFRWESGIDPNGFSTYDDFRLDGGFQGRVSSPITRNLELGSHTWGVRTCNSYCCSAWATSDLEIGNNPPSPPIADYTLSSGILTMSWVSGIDPEGDVTYDEFQLENESVVSPANSPIVTTSKKLVKWKVRTCDIFSACSEWTEVFSVTCEEVSVTCPSSGEVRRIIEKIIESCPAAKAPTTEVYCDGIQIAEELILKVDLEPGAESKVKLSGKNFILEDLDYCPWCFDGIQNYDEEGIDCGGKSCPPCPAYKKKSFIERNLFWIIIIVLALSFVIYLIWRKQSYNKQASEKKLKKQGLSQQRTGNKYRKI